MAGRTVSLLERDWGYGKYLESHGLATNGEDFHEGPPHLARLSSLTGLLSSKAYVGSNKERSYVTISGPTTALLRQWNPQDETWNFF